jgi:predicted RNA binding protein YcfA (HicA-like mRNA interferase family)
MAKIRLKRRQLARILASFGIDEDTKRGKGSHTVFFVNTDKGKLTYPIPKGKDVKPCYVKGSRKKFSLTPEDGISDEEFFGKL